MEEPKANQNPDLMKITFNVSEFRSNKEFEFTKMIHKTRDVIDLFETAEKEIKSRMNFNSSAYAFHLVNRGHTLKKT